MDYFHQKCARFHLNRFNRFRNGLCFSRMHSRGRIYFLKFVLKSNSASTPLSQWWIQNRSRKLTRAPLGGGRNAPPPTLNPKISPKLKQIMTRNLPYLSVQQFHILCQKKWIPGHNRSAVSDVSVPPISTKNKGFTGIAATDAVLKQVTIHWLI